MTAGFVVVRGCVAIGPHSVVAERDVAISWGSVRVVVVSVLTVLLLQTTRGKLGVRPSGAIVDPTPWSAKAAPFRQAHFGADLSGKH